MKAIKDFIKENTAGVAGKAFLGISAVQIAQSDHKLKDLVKTVASLIFLKPALAAMFVGVFTSAQKAIRSVLKDTGSLDAALRKLATIQGFQRMFAPLVGGAEAAKRKIAELINYSAHKGLKFESVAEATRSLQIFTRGVFSSIKAIDTINDAAEATGNTITDMADAVAEFSDQLRGGGGIDGAAEKLRRMGAITQATADQLLTLKATGASSYQIFDTLTESLDQFAGTADTLKGELKAVNLELEQAQANLKEKFASPWVAGDVENTRNMTAAMNAFAPALERVSKWATVLFGGIDTLKSRMVAWAGENSVVRGTVEGVAKALMLVIAAAGVLGGIALSLWLFSAAAGAGALAARLIQVTGAAGAAATAITAVGVASRIALAASGVGAILLVIGMIVGAYIQYADAAQTAQKAQDGLNKANQQANDALMKQIGAVKTLTDRHEALAAAIKEVTEAQREYEAARKEMKETDNPDEEQRAGWRRAIDRYKNARTAAGAAAGISSSGLAPTDAAQENSRMRAQRNRMLTDAGFDARLETASGPGERERINQERITELKRRVGRGALGLTARESVRAAEERAERQAQVAELGGDSQMAAYARNKRDSAWRTAPKSSSVYQQGIAGSDMYSGASRAKAALAAEIAKLDEDSVVANTEKIKQMEAQQASSRVGRSKGGMAAGAELRRQGALLAGDATGVQGVDDSDMVRSKYEENLSRGMLPAEAKAKALQFAGGSVSLDARDTALSVNAATAASSLARIGGGGNVATSSGDPMLDIAKRQEDLLESINDYLEKIAEAKGVLLKP